MVRRPSLAPTVTKRSGSDRKAGAHIRIAECEDGAGFVHTLRHNKFEMPIFVLRDGKIGNIA